MRYFVVVDQEMKFGAAREIITETVYMTDRVELASLLSREINASAIPGFSAHIEAE